MKAAKSLIQPPLHYSSYLHFLPIANGGFLLCEGWPGTVLKTLAHITHTGGIGPFCWIIDYGQENWALNGSELSMKLAALDQLLGLDLNFELRAAVDEWQAYLHPLATPQERSDSNQAECTASAADVLTR